MKRAIEAGIREGLGADVGTFKASTSRSAPPDGPERLAGDAEDELDDLDDAQARRILREFMYDVELGAAARRALREFRQLRASASGIHCTRMGPERFIQAHPAVLEALGVASFHGNG
jgi:hypothetical protein